VASSASHVVPRVAAATLRRIARPHHYRRASRRSAPRFQRAGSAASTTRGAQRRQRNSSAKNTSRRARFNALSNN
jgi:hypothetical protein